LFLGRALLLRFLLVHVAHRTGDELLARLDILGDGLLALSPSRLLATK
jgi:hypothetical protein